MAPPDFRRMLYHLSHRDHYSACSHPEGADINTCECLTTYLGNIQEFLKSDFRFS